METLGQRITAAREDKKLPKTALAALVGVSVATVKRWEKGLTYPDYLELNRIAIATQAPLEDIVGTRDHYRAELEARDEQREAV